MIRRNAALLLAARVTSAGTTLVLLAIVARLAGADALGAVGVGIALGSVAAAVTDAGISPLLVREAARRPLVAGEIIGLGLAVRLLTVPATLVIVVLAAGLAAPDAVETVLLVAGGLVAQQTAELTRSVFNAAQRMTVSATHAIIENIVWLMAISVPLALGWPLNGALWLALGAWLASVATGLVLAVRVAAVRPTLPALSRVRSLGASAAPFVAFNAIGIGYSRIDTFLVAALLPNGGLAAAGTYFASARLVSAFEYVPEAVSRAMYPELSRRTVEDRGSGAVLLGQAARSLLLLGAVVPAVLVVGGGAFMEALFGSDPRIAGFVVGALSIAVPVRFLGYLYGVTLTSSDAQGRRVAAAAVGLVLVVGINVALLPQVGLLAPVVATVLAAVVILVLYATFVRRRLGTTGLPSALIARVGALSVAAAIVGALVEPVAGPLAASTVVLVAYGAGLAVGSLRRPLSRVDAEAVPGP